MKSKINTAAILMNLGMVILLGAGLGLLGFLLLTSYA